LTALPLGQYRGDGRPVWLLTDRSVSSVEDGHALSSPKVIKGVRRHPLTVSAARRSGRGGGRSRILEAALELFRTKGYSDVSMNDVAKAAGVTKAALYYHFVDKADLYTKVSLDRIESIRQAMDESVGEGGDLRGRLERLALVGFDRLQNEVYQPHLHAHEHLGEAHHQELHAAMDRLEEPVIRCFEEAGVPDAQLTPRAAATLLGGIMFSLIFASGNPVTSASPLPADRADRARLAIALFLGGYWAVARGNDPDPGPGRG
jgi:AcrR family transcriptional regulator